MDEKPADSEVTSSMLSSDKEEPESKTKAENGTAKLHLDVEEPPTKSPKADLDTKDLSVDMVSMTVPMTPRNDVLPVQLPLPLDQEGNRDEVGLIFQARDRNMPNQTSDVSGQKDSPTSDSEEPMSISEPEPEVQVELRVIYNKQPIPVKISLKRTVGDLKKMIEKTTKVTPELMKVLVKGAKDNVTLESIGLSKGSKVIVIGTPLDDVLAISKPPTAKELSGEDSIGSSSSSSDSQNWCSLPRHQKVIDKGLPDDVMAGISGEQEPLPPFPLIGILSSKCAKVRLTFKLEADELWIGTKERTEKIPIGTIRTVVSQPIIGFEHYHIVAIQLGTTEASRFFFYWVPCQYVNAIKRVLGS